MSKEHRVLITGAGLVSPLGSTLSDFWLEVCAGRVGVCVGDTAPFNISPIERPVRTEKPQQMMIASALHAVKDAGFEHGLPESTAVCIGSAFSTSHIDTPLSAASGTDSQKLLMALLGDDLPGELARTLHVSGPTELYCHGSAAGASALGRAAEWIRGGLHDLALVVGVDVPHHELMPEVRDLEAEKWAGPFCETVSTEILPSESAGCVVLESHEHAARRGAQAYGEWEGWANSSNETEWGVMCSDLYRALSRSCRNARCTPAMINLVLLTGLGVPSSDQAELSAVQELWEGMIPKPVITTVGGHCGHPFAATGLIQFITALTCMGESMVPPVRNVCGGVELWNGYSNTLSADGTVNRALILTTGIGRSHVSTVVTRGTDHRRVANMVVRDE